MKRYPIAIVVLGLLATYLLHRVVEAPSPPPPTADAPAAHNASDTSPTASSVPRTIAAPAPATPSVTTPPPVGPVPAPRAAEADSPEVAVRERMLIAGDALAGQCATQFMWDARRFSDLLKALRHGVAGNAGIEAQRRAISAAYREAFALSGGGAELIDAACGAQLCAVEIRLPADTADDEVREAMVARLLGGLIGVVGTQFTAASVDGASRENRRIFSVSDEVSRLGPRQCSE